MFLQLLHSLRNPAGKYIQPERSYEFEEIIL